MIFIRFDENASGIFSSFSHQNQAKSIENDNGKFRQPNEHDHLLFRFIELVNK